MSFVSEWTPKHGMTDEQVVLFFFSYRINTMGKYMRYCDSMYLLYNFGKLISCEKKKKKEREREKEREKERKLFGGYVQLKEI